MSTFPFPLYFIFSIVKKDTKWVLYTIWFGGAINNNGQVVFRAEDRKLKFAGYEIVFDIEYFYAPGGYLIPYPGSRAVDTYRYTDGDSVLVSTDSNIPKPVGQLLNQNLNKKVTDNSLQEYAVIGDNGNVAFLESATDSLVVYDQSLTTKLAAIYTPVIGNIGNQPGISDNGEIVVFYQEDNQKGSSGIFAWVNGQIIQIAGTSGNDGQLDPWDTYDDLNLNGKFDVGEVDTSLFAGFDANSRISVNIEQSGVANIVYVGFDNNSATKGIYASSLFLNANTPAIVTKPVVEVEVGNTIPGDSGIIQDLKLYDSINKNGQVAFWANTTAGEIIATVTPAKIIVENVWGMAKDGVIKFKVRLSKPLTEDLLLAYQTLDGSANSSNTNGSDKQDFKKDIGILTFKAGSLVPEEGDIKVNIFDNEAALTTDKDFEFLSRDTAYRNWTTNNTKEGETKKGADIDQVSEIKADLGYRVNQFFNDSKTDFQAVGLTGAEKFYLVVYSASSATLGNAPK